MSCKAGHEQHTTSSGTPRVCRSAGGDVAHHSVVAPAAHHRHFHPPLPYTPSLDRTLDTRHGTLWFLPVLHFETKCMAGSHTFTCKPTLYTPLPMDGLHTCPMPYHRLPPPPCRHGREITRLHMTSLTQPEQLHTPLPPPSCTVDIHGRDCRQLRCNYASCPPSTCPVWSRIFAPSSFLGPQLATILALTPARGQ